ncbi:hypothetical protein [Salsipaludibacter albus]|uniref:hypothetical protein n=1 Tax=Salsipaludibacter albus TaxID=2849650 RepID=UPI001EE3A7AD|nr:hypothetical protein [Salsipaludibacter albus]MBY5161081.1 hypothetical protein [Salsipaludibacter albus]
MTSLLTTLLLATEGAEGLSGDHIASKLAVPLGIIIFCGSIFALLWSNYGAKKGALIYGTAMGGFCFMLGIFWWFGAPGTPVATGLQNFPGQPADQYQSSIFAFEPGSETATYFDAANDLSDFASVADFLGKGDASDDDLSSDPRYTSLDGEVAQAEALMVALALRTDDNGDSQLGGDARGEYQEAGQAGLEEEVGADAAADFTRAEPFFSGVPGDRLITESNGTLLFGTEVEMETNWLGPDGETVTVPVDTVTMFAFKEPSALWFPSAVWSAISLLLFVGSLFGLDRMEMREKRRAQEVQEPEDLAVSIRQ